MHHINWAVYWKGFDECQDFVRSSIVFSELHLDDDVRGSDVSLGGSVWRFSRQVPLMQT